MARLGDILVAAGLATEEQRARALLQHRREGGRFGTGLLEAGVPEDAVARALGSQFDVPPATGAELEEIRTEVLRLIPARTAQRLGLVPFRRDGRVLHVAMKDPRDLRALDDASLASGLDIRPSVALEARIDTALAKHYGSRVEPRNVAAIRLSGIRKLPEPTSLTPGDQGTAPRRARSSTLRIVYPPPFISFEETPMLPSTPTPGRSATAPDRSDPWSSTDTGVATAALPRSPATEIVEDSLRAPVPRDTTPPPAPEPPPDLVPDGPEPTIEERLAEELGVAETREEVVDAVLAATSNYVRRAAIFVVDGDHIAGWGAEPEPEADLQEFRLPLSEASVFATLRDTEGFYVGTYMDLPSTVKVLRALSSDGIGTMAVVPVTLKGKTGLYLWGESESYTRPPSVPALKRLAAMLTTGLEIVRLKSRLYAL